MNISQLYIIIAIVVLAVIVVLLLVVGRTGKGKRLTALASIAFAFIVAGIIFSENRLIGYGLMGVGVLLAIVDIYKKSK